MPDAIINPAALEPLFGPSDIPTHHRVRAKTRGAPAEVIKGRRPSRITITQNLRRAVAEWREAQYGGASDTTIELLNHWFNRDHQVTTPAGETIPFAYYFCQREALEALIYLYEVRGIRTLSGLTAEFGGLDSEIAALGIDPDEDLWPRYAFKVATGAGKTKIMSLAVVWSYCHALRESDSPMARILPASSRPVAVCTSACRASRQAWASAPRCRPSRLHTRLSQSLGELRKV